MSRTLYFDYNGQELDLAAAKMVSDKIPNFLMLKRTNKGYKGC